METNTISSATLGSPVRFIVVLNLNRPFASTAQFATFNRRSDTAARDGGSSHRYRSRRESSAVARSSA
ncbi:hypothetical protein E0H70_16470 [Rhizobium leguminosarum bv. viciae]|nr:hypothetical protein E0H70_16470 [Rhizobium leguminosarum bv. viciae]